MRVTCKSNGKIQVFLEPETTIESAYIETMVERASKGAQPKIETFQGERSGMSITMGE